MSRQISLQRQKSFFFFFFFRIGRTSPKKVQPTTVSSVRKLFQTSMEKDDASIHKQLLDKMFSRRGSNQVFVDQLWFVVYVSGCHSHSMGIHDLTYMTSEEVSLKYE